MEQAKRRTDLVISYKQKSRLKKKHAQNAIKQKKLDVSALPRASDSLVPRPVVCHDRPLLPTP